MSRETGRALATSLAVFSLAFGTSLGLLFVSGPLSAPCATTTGVRYACLLVILPLPSPGASSTSTRVVLFAGVIFELRVDNWGSPGGGVLNGKGTEPTDASWSFSLFGGPIVDPPATWISPDGWFGVQWDGGGANGSTFVNLLARS